MSTLAVNIIIINGTEHELSLKNAWYAKDDWEVPPNFPELVAPSTNLVIKAEANYYRKNVPFSVTVGCNGSDFAIDKYDPYHDKWTVTSKQTDKLAVTMVTGPSVNSGRYDVMILVTGTKYSG